ncbi:uncharacterized protein ASCRUDRAFT_70247 [Ascoidea rubescens DSM 1968]|uniref:Uncharacterized protein n=1 Tax=Ascoidea rubescens DSM 1968 TaxID=1344418 RepID=A0A1D2VHE4_9ASCO|nr:hypothetical protein ASCRUDRAFT_70247 [Ascoidea rubescens DSM 1968]ODV61012.1 hypothetical protein ASCRUDRAFT_70247 [Ascoidea rubescens DSM 1968]
MANIKDAEFILPDDFEDACSSRAPVFTSHDPMLILIRDFDLQVDTFPEIIITEEIQSQITNADILVALIFMEGKHERFIHYIECDPKSFDIHPQDYKLRNVRVEYQIKTSKTRDFVLPGTYYFVFTTSLKYGPKRLYSEAFQVSN